MIVIAPNVFYIWQIIHFVHLHRDRTCNSATSIVWLVVHLGCRIDLVLGRVGEKEIICIRESSYVITERYSI